MPFPLHSCDSGHGKKGELDLHDQGLGMVERYFNENVTRIPHTAHGRGFRTKAEGWRNGTLTTTRRAFRTASREAAGWPKVDSVFFTKPSFMSAMDIAVRMPGDGTNVRVSEAGA